MGASELVGGLPGGQALVDLGQKVRGRPEAVRAVARHWTDAATKCGECDTAVNQSVATLHGAWEGSSANGFVAYMGSFGQAGSSIEDTLTNSAGELVKAATALESALRSIDGICENLLTEVKRHRAQNPDETGEKSDAAIRPLVEAAVNSAKPAADEAEQALSGALTRINSYVGGLSSKFSALPGPDGQPFVPNAGHQVDWKPAPPESTSQSGAGPDSVVSPGTGQEPGVSAGGSQGSGGGGHAGAGGGHIGGGGGMGSSGGPPPGGGPAPQGQVAEWINEAIEILTQQGVDVSKMNANDIWAIIQHESGGNPHAINNWDSNAAKGTPSKGLMQCIDPTFQSHMLPGHEDIWNPVDNIIAGIRYSISRYGSVSNVPGVVGVKSGGGYRGY